MNQPVSPLPITPSSPSPSIPKAPPFFQTVGWSWLLMGALTLVLGLLSLPSLFSTQELQSLFSRPEFTPYPMMGEMVASWLRFLPVVVVAHILVGGIMVWVSWQFLQRQNWARWGLSAVNAASMGVALWTTYLANSFFQKMALSIHLQDMVEMGLIENIPYYFQLFLWISLALLMLPLILMAWYLHCRRVVDYF